MARTRALSPGDIVPVHFNGSKSTKTLALVRRSREVQGGPATVFDVLYNDGTEGIAVGWDALGDPIAADKPEELLKHTFRDCRPESLFQLLIVMRSIAALGAAAGTVKMK